jgi:hypothetical protein
LKIVASQFIYATILILNVYIVLLNITDNTC